MGKLYVSNKDESVQLFGNRFLELFTKVHFSIPLFFYVPVVVYFLYQSALHPELGWKMIVLLFIGGVFAWSFAEYFLHRFVFHYHPTSEWGKRVHFLMHGVHHDYPNDSKRLVMPPSVSIPLAFLFFFLFKLLFTGVTYWPFFAGFVAGYLVYDMLHYAIHHANMQGKWWIALKTHHLKHHFKDPDKGYGVSSPLWDVIIGSEFGSSKEDKKQIKHQSVDT